MRFFLLFLLLLPNLARGEVPALSARINDYATLLSQETATRLEQQLTELEQRDGTQIALLTINSLEGASLEGYALEAAEKWGLGQKGRDNGALLLIAKKERKIRIETGYGLESQLTDLRCGRIIRNDIAPLFKRGDFDGGIAAGITAMIRTVQGEYSAADHKNNASVQDLESFASFMLVAFLGIGNIFRKKHALAGLAGGVASPLFGLLFFGVQMPLLLLLVPGGFFLGFIASLMAASMKRTGSSGRRFHRSSYGRNSRHSGGFYGSSGGFRGGGGSFGGGGASGGW